MSLRLVLDFGNTAQKAFLFSNNEIIASKWLASPSADEILSFIAFKPVEAAILASVIHHPADIAEKISRETMLVELNEETPLPVLNGYSTPQSLGYDRIAAAVAARQLFPGSPVLAITAGTCLLYDIVDADGKYLGGAISPGLRMRFKALNSFTGKLPLVEPADETALVGDSTENSIRAGVQHAATAEINGMIDAYEKEFPGLQTVIGGGDALFFEKALKNRIFARPNLVAEGLHQILAFNMANHLLKPNA